MKVAVTGATGLLGTSLVQGLLQQGHEVVVLARQVERALAQLPAGVKGVRWEAGRALEAKGLEGVEAVVHLAGEPVAQRWTEEARRRIRASRVEGTRGLVEALRAVGSVRHLLSASAVGYYGGERGAEPLTEESAPGEGFLAEVCREWEAEARAAEAAGVRTVLLRIGVVLHPEGGALKQVLPVFRLGLGGRLGTGQQYMSWIHREDTVGMMLWALEQTQVAGPVNVVAPQPVTNAEFTQVLGRVLGRPTLMAVPGLALRAVYGDMSQVVLGGQRVLPKRAQEAGYRFKHPELEGALRSLLG